MRFAGGGEQARWHAPERTRGRGRAARPRYGVGTPTRAPSSRTAPVSASSSSGRPARASCSIDGVKSPSLRVTACRSCGVCAIGQPIRPPISRASSIAAEHELPDQVVVEGGPGRGAGDRADRVERQVAPQLVPDVVPDPVGDGDVEAGRAQRGRQRAQPGRGRRAAGELADDQPVPRPPVDHAGRGRGRRQVHGAADHPGGRQRRRDQRRRDRRCPGARPAAGPPKPSRNHHGTPFSVDSTAVAGPSSGPIDAATDAIDCALTATITTSCGPSARRVGCGGQPGWPRPEPVRRASSTRSPSALSAPGSRRARAPTRSTPSTRASPDAMTPPIDPAPTTQIRMTPIQHSIPPLRPPVCESRTMHTSTSHPVTSGRYPWRVAGPPASFRRPSRSPSRTRPPRRSGWTSRTPPSPCPRWPRQLTTDLAIVGGGFTGLWTALLAKERDPSRDVALLEARTVGNAASGRNGGFCSASLTHGIANGLERFPAEMPLLEKLGEQNLSEIGATIAKHDIDCDFQLTGELSVATARLAARGDRGGGGRRPRARPRRRGARRRGDPPRAQLADARRRPEVHAPATRWSSRAGSPGGCAAPAWTRACGSTSRRRSPRLPPAAPG